MELHLYRMLAIALLMLAGVPPCAGATVTQNTGGGGSTSYGQTPIVP
jgi:hypothetical protein